MLSRIIKKIFEAILIFGFLPLSMFFYYSPSLFGRHIRIVTIVPKVHPRQADMQISIGLLLPPPVIN